MPETHSGCRRIAPATRASAPSGAVASLAKARASPTSDAESSGAPQPSTATAVTGSPVSSANVSAIACWSGWSGSRYVARSQPLSAQVTSIAACLPEQFIAIGLLGSPARIISSRAASSSE